MLATQGAAVTKYDDIADVPHEMVERFDAQMMLVTRGPSCWRWTGKIDPAGYGGVVLQTEGRYRYIGAHRLAYLVANERIAPGLVIDHICRNRRCVNPAHLRAVTVQENVRAGLAGDMKTSCNQGHPLSGPNLHVVHRSDGRTSRCCRICRLDNKRRYRAKKAE